MRLREIKNILQKYIPLLELNTTSRNSNPRTYQLTNADNIQKGISGLKEIGLFDKYLKILEKQSFYSFTGSNIMITDNEFKVLSKTIPEIKAIAQGIVDAISQTIDSNDENVISIKIPEPQNFDDLETTSKKLHQIFSQTLLSKEIQGGIRIKNFDSGSYWIDIVASSKEIVGLIAALTWAGVVVYKKLQEGKFLQEKVREMKISNDAIEEIVEQSKKAVNTEANNEANFLYNTFFKGRDNEQVERIKVALKELANLYSKGTEIHPSLNANIEVKESFPDFKRIENVNSKIKKLEQKK